MKSLRRVRFGRRRLLMTFLMLSLCLAIHAFVFSTTRSAEGEALIGSPAPEWNNRDWINSRPLKLSQLKGKVVLLRFFMDSACPMCSATAPSLNYFYSKYKSQGLIVVGMYTPKPRPANRPISQVREYVRDFKFEFPVALDNDWATLKSFWLDRVPDASFTSASFLIDRKGVIRFIHPGGEYGEAGKDKTSREDFAEMERMIEKLVGERE